MAGNDGVDESARPHGGWSRQPQETYESGDSGGWGGPGRNTHTGPMPRLRREPGDRTPPEGRDGPGGEPRGAHAPGEDGPAGEVEDDGYGDEFDAGVHHEEYDAQVHDTRRGPERTAGPALASLVDLRFARRSTRPLVSFAYVLIVVFLVLDYMRSIYDYSATAGGSGATVAGGVVMVLIVGLFKVVALTCLVRILFDLCLDVASLAHDGGGRY